VAHFLNHDPRDGAPVPIRRSIFQKIALLLNAGEFRIALVDDHVHQSIAHLLGGNLPQVLPLAPAFVRAEFDLIGIDRAIKRVEVKIFNILGIDANIFAPVVEHSDPVAKCSDFCYLTRHKYDSLQQ